MSGAEGRKQWGLSLIHIYVGSEGITPRLSKMGGADWKRMKSRAATAIPQLAEDCLLYTSVIRLDDTGGKYVSFKMEFDR